MPGRQGATPSQPHSIEEDPLTPPPATTQDPAEQVERRDLPLFLRLFGIPALIVVICVAIFVLFGALALDEKTPAEFLAQIRSEEASQRWQGAYELAKVLTTPGAATRDASLVPALIATFEEARRDDPRVRRYLALALGRAGDTRAEAALVGALSDPDGETRLYAIWALGNLRARGAPSALLPLLHDEDPGIRKMTAYALGSLRDPRARGPLQDSLQDGQEDVRWNAALALAQLGDRSAEGLLLQMLDRRHLETIPGLGEERTAEVMTNAMKGLTLLGARSAEPILGDIARQDKNLRVRQSALEALAALRE